MRASLKLVVFVALAASACGDQTPTSAPSSAEQSTAEPAVASSQKSCNDPVKSCKAGAAIVDPSSCEQFCADGSTPQ